MNILVQNYKSHVWEDLLVVNYKKPLYWPKDHQHH